MMMVFGISSLRNKHLARALLLFIMVMVVESSAAKTYVAQAVDSRQSVLPSADNGHGGVALDERNLIYFARINNVDGLYRFNVETKITSLLRTIGPVNNVSGFPGGGRHNAMADGLALLSVNGKLYATDGTPTGTSMVRDFGSSFCCGSFPFELSVIRGIYLIGGIFYIVTESPDLPASSNSELWRTDGTSGGTRRIGTVQPPIVEPFSADIDNENSVLFIVDLENGAELRKINQDESTSLIHQFEPSTQFFRGGNSVRNRNGTYLCSDENDPQSFTRTGETTLWRISNNGVVTSIEDGCHDNTLTVSDERIFYFNDQGLQSTDGLNGNARMEVPLPVPRNQRGFDFCEFSGSIYYAINEAQILEINAGAMRTIRGTTTISGRPEVLLCSPSKMLISNDFLSDSPSPHIFDISNESFSVLRNMDRITSCTVIENDRGELFSFAPLRAGDQSELIKIKLSLPLVPQLMLLLDDE